MSKTSSGDAPIGIIAAKGEMPLRLARAIAESGRGVFVVRLKSMADGDDAAYAGLDSAVFPVGKLEAIIAALTEKHCTEILLAGKFTRPKMRDAMPDALAAEVMAATLAKGDNAALEALAAILARHGMRLGDVADYPGGAAAAGAGHLAGPAPDDAMRDAAAYGAEVLAGLGGFDIGQSVVMQGRRVIAVEAAEGTDAMIARAGALLDPGLADAPPLLVKMPKAGQQSHLDPPMIGAATIAAAAGAGIRGIAVEAGGVLITDSKATCAAAEAHGIALFGIKPPAGNPR